MRPYKRRRILVENFQYRLLVANLIYFFTILLSFAGALFLPLIIQLKSAALSWNDKQAAASQFLSLHTHLWPAIFVVFALLALHSIVVSHRIAGPLYRFRQVLQALADGDLSVRATIRKNDYLGKEAEVVNEVIARLATKLSGMQEQCNEIRGTLTTIMSAVASGSAGDLKQNVADLATQMGRLQADLDHFRTAAVEQGRAQPVPPEETHR
jgi:methyl-accepting chemotaxis protein